MLDNLMRFLRFLLVDNGSITLVAALGLIAVYLLLPRPHGRSVVGGAALAGLALFLFGALLVRVGALTAESLLFYAFSAIAIIAGVLLITQSNPARAALSFALVVLSTCGLFLLQAAPFLMAATTIIYAGAIIVTFLFVIMLAQQTGVSDADLRSREPALAAATGFVLLGALLYVLHVSYGTEEIGPFIARAAAAKEAATIAEMAEALQDDSKDNQAYFTGFRKAMLKEQERIEFGIDAEVRSPAQKFAGQLANLQTDWIDARERGNVEEAKEVFARLETLGKQARQSFAVLQPRDTRPMSDLSGPSANTALFPPPPKADNQFPPRGEEGKKVPAIRRDEVTGRPELPAENAAYLGRSLFTDNLLAVELAGTLLLVATIGAIAIAQRRGEGNA